jgi:hypothetical protein
MERRFSFIQEGAARIVHLDICARIWILGCKCIIARGLMSCDYRVGKAVAFDNCMLETLNTHIPTLHPRPATRDLRYTIFPTVAASLMDNRLKQSPSSLSHNSRRVNDTHLILLHL